ncbi:MAG: hypothetical protein KY445_04470 [Armatimonadetes bacterium]|nr:hypothetical protein [Armatimonadota bacterium]
MIENIKTIEPYLRVYPPNEQVFAEPVERYARHILPLLSIDLSAINSSWEGWIHLVNTVEPEDEMVGKATQRFHNYYLRENWVGFHLNDQGRYELLGDFRYFYLENPPGTLPEHYPGDRQEMEEHYANQHAGFAQARERFGQHGVFFSHSLVRYNPDLDLSQQSPSILIGQLGGGVGAGNWAHGFSLDESDEENVRPVTPEGVPFYFIASVTGWDYCPSGADQILLFYEPASRTALVTFDWS